MKLVAPWHVPVLLLALLTIVFRVSNADLEICRLCYEHGERSWVGLNSSFLWFVYHAGPLPALAVGIGGLVIGIAGLILPRFRPYREAGLFLAAMLALGPGLLVNGVFKPYWHRPRPIQTQTFGGSEQFLPVWELGSNPHGRSFPCGHASMGFYLIAPAFLMSHRRRLAMAFVGLGLASGLLIGAGRIMQGAHYPSDVVWSAGMVYLSGVAVLGAFQLAKSAARRSEPRAEPSPEPVPVLLPFPGRGRRGPIAAEEAPPTRRAA